MSYKQGYNRNDYVDQAGDSARLAEISSSTSLWDDDHRLMTTAIIAKLLYLNTTFQERAGMMPLPDRGISPRSRALLGLKLRQSSPSSLSSVTPRSINHALVSSMSTSSAPYSKSSAPQQECSGHVHLWSHNQRDLTPWQSLHYGTDRDYHRKSHQFLPQINWT